MMVKLYNLTVLFNSIAVNTYEDVSYKTHLIQNLENRVFSIKLIYR